MYKNPVESKINAFLTCLMVPYFPQKIVLHIFLEKFREISFLDGKLRTYPKFFMLGHNFIMYMYLIECFMSL